MQAVTVVHLHSIFDCPPVISLIQCLLDMGCKVNLVSFDVNKLPDSVLNHPHFKYATRDLDTLRTSGLMGAWGKFKRLYIRETFCKKCTKEFMRHSNVLWTTTDVTVGCLGKMVYRYKHIMQLMELIPNKYILMYRGLVKVTVSKFAQRAFRVVVPEINRAYIQQIWWNLKYTPMVLPNKPYLLERVSEDHLDEETKKKLDKIKSDSRKKILYLGAICRDRDLKSCAEAVKRMGPNYCLYILGRAVSQDTQKELDELIAQYDCVEYLGFVKSPAHLAFVKYAYIGLLPYIISDKLRNISPLNSLYCAPNKIYEYAKYGLPMVGSDVLGLKEPFDKYNIGVCAREWTPEALEKALQAVALNHDAMSKNCKAFYEATDFAGIVKEIIEEA